MKKFLMLSVLSVQFLCFTVYSRPIIPKELWGFWRFSVDNPGEWNGSLIGGNYIEHFYQICRVDSLKKTNTGYKIFLTDEKQLLLTLEIERLGQDKASFRFSNWKEARICNRSDNDPDITFFNGKNAPKFFSQHWIGTVGNDKDFHLTNNFKFRQNGKEWKIIWAGRYLGKEYRFLLSDGKSHHIAYITKLQKSLIINDLNGQHTYLARSENSIIKSIIGNWADANDNNWRYGFFENFVIVDQKIYTYKYIGRKGNNITLKVSNKLDERLIKMTFHNDSSVTLISDQGNLQLYRVAKVLRPAKKIDTVSFVDTHFQKIDTATIRGYLRNVPNDKPFSVIINDPLTQKQVFYYGDLDTNGLFEVKIPLLNTTFAVLDWGRLGSGDVDAITPGEIFFYYRDFNTKQKLAMGDNSQFHNEIINYDLYGASGWTNDLSKSKSLEFLNIKKTQNKKATEVLNSYLINNPYATSRFRYFVTEFNRFNIGYDLMQRRFHPDSGGNRLPESFMKYVIDTIYQNRPPTPISLIREFNIFKNDYYNYVKEAEFSVNTDSLFLQMLNNDELGATEDEKKALLAEITIFRINVKNSATKKMAPDVKLSKEQIMLVRKFRTTHGEEVQNKIDRKLRILINAKNERVNNGMPKGDLKEIYFAQNLYGALISNNVAFQDDIFQEALLKIKSPMFRQTIIKQQDYLKQLSKVDIEYVESLKRTDHLKDAKNADSLLAALIQPYKGKVIYVDFWGTWCSPCITEMPYVKSLKDGFEGRDVIFMYFANNSPESSWKNVINQHHLTGPNVVHYRLPYAQQSLIETRLSIQSFPTYMLIDKEGNIVTMKAPRPSDHEKLTSTINGMLE